MQISIHGEEGIMNELVPNFILQPLVENGIKHGIAKKKDANRIEIGMEGLGETMKLCVYNEGPPLVEEPNGLRKGIGLNSTKSRLEFVYGDKAHLELISVNDGVVAEIFLSKHTSNIEGFK